MFPTLEDFTTVAAGWKELEENVVYQIVNTKVVHTHMDSLLYCLCKRKMERVRLSGLVEC